MRPTSSKRTLEDCPSHFRAARSGLFAHDQGLAIAQSRLLLKAHAAPDISESTGLHRQVLTSARYLSALMTQVILPNLNLVSRQLPAAGGSTLGSLLIAPQLSQENAHFLTPVYRAIPNLSRLLANSCFDLSTRRPPSCFPLQCSRPQVHTFPWRQPTCRGCIERVNGIYIVLPPDPSAKQHSSNWRSVAR